VAEAADAKDAKKMEFEINFYNIKKVITQPELFTQRLSLFFSPQTPLRVAEAADAKGAK